MDTTQQCRKIKKLKEKSFIDNLGTCLCFKNVREKNQGLGEGRFRI